MYSYARARIQFKYTFFIQSLSVVVIFLGLVIARATDFRHLQSLDITLELTIFVEVFGRIMSPFARKYIPFFSYRPVEGETSNGNFYPIDIYFVQKRLGAFVMLALGECFITLLENTPKVQGSKSSNALLSCFLMSATILIWSLATSYYDSVQRKKSYLGGYEVHAMARSKMAGIIWQFMHVVVCYAIFLVGVGLKRSYLALNHGDHIQDTDVTLLSIGCSLATFGFAFMRALHKGFYYNYFNMHL